MGSIGLRLRQRVRHRLSDVAAAVRLDHDAADVAVDDRGQRPDRVHVLAVAGEVGALAAVEPTAVDEQRLVAIVQRDPLDLMLVEVEADAVGDSVEELEAISVAAIDLRLLSVPVGQRVARRSARGARGRTSRRRARARRWRTRSTASLARCRPSSSRAWLKSEAQSRRNRLSHCCLGWRTVRGRTTPIERSDTSLACPVMEPRSRGVYQARSQTREEVPTRTDPSGLPGPNDRAGCSPDDSRRASRRGYRHGNPLPPLSIALTSSRL